MAHLDTICQTFSSSRYWGGRGVWGGEVQMKPESHVMLPEYSWTHWVITTPILISSYHICCHTASLCNEEMLQHDFEANGFILKDAWTADKWLSSQSGRIEWSQKKQKTKKQQQNKLQGWGFVPSTCLHLIDDLKHWERDGYVGGWGVVEWV